MTIGETNSFIRYAVDVRCADLALRVIAGYISVAHVIGQYDDYVWTGVLSGCREKCEWCHDETDCEEN